MINRWMWAAGVAAAVLLGAANPALAASKAPTATPDAAARYRACLARVATDPFAAVQEARAWQDAGGGDPARHCAAAGKLALGQSAEAAEDLEHLAATDGIPLDRQTMLFTQAAEAWLQAGRSQRAVDVMDRALAVRPGDPGLLMERARAEVEGGQTDRAIADLGLAIDVDPLQPEAYVLRASALRRTGAFDRAAADLATALSLDPRQPDALLERGLLRQAAGDQAGAVADWTAVVNGAPTSAAAEMARRHLAMGQGGHPGGKPGGG
ncbi:MAG: tetratricopeptide repeat protein [Rhodospirillales bacterium]